MLLAAGLLLVPFATAAQAEAPASPWVPADRLTHVQPTADSDFGQAVHVDGDIAVVGDPAQDRAHVYERTGVTWLQAQTLDGPAGFGSSVAVDGDTIVVGAPDASAAHVYRSGAEGWEPAATLTVPDASCLGSTVDVDVGTIVAGDPCSSDAAYGFERTSTGWARVADATVSGEASFGRDVAVSSGTVIVGAGGTGYVMEASDTGWSDPVELASSIPAGRSVAISGSTAVLGASGAAVVFERQAGTWTQTSTLEPSDASPFHESARFGIAVDLVEDTIVVGAFNDDANPGRPSVPATLFDPCVSQFGFGACAPERPGAAYVFERPAGSWDQVAKLVGDPAGDHQFGFAVAVTGGVGSDSQTVLVGAPHNLRSAIGGAVDVDVEDSVFVFDQVGAR